MHGRSKATLCSRWVLTWCAAVAISTSPGTASAGTCDQIVVFGTSLSDPGNAFALYGGTNVPPHYSLSPLLVPDKAYATGGHHFSNGATWIEQFAVAVGMAASAGPAFLAADPGAANFAVAGARAYDDGKNVNLSAQVNAFFEQCGGVASPDALYVIDMGGNDLFDAMTVFFEGNAGVVIQAALTSIAANITELYTHGARTFVVANAPNVGLTPATRMLESMSPGAMNLATRLTIAFNDGLAAVVGQLSALSGISIRGLDRYQVLNEIVSNPAAFGMSNVTTPCITPNVEPFVCPDPDRFLFWDGIHPTRAAHAIIAQRTAVLLAQ